MAGPAEESFWCFIGIDTVIMLILSLTGSGFEFKRQMPSIFEVFGSNPFMYSYALLTLLPRWALIWRRFHDHNENGLAVGYFFFMSIYFVCALLFNLPAPPNVLALLMLFSYLICGLYILVICAKKGQPTENQYGPVPDDDPDWNPAPPNRPNTGQAD